MKHGETSAMGHYAAPSSTPPTGMRFMTCSLMGSVTHLYTYKSRLASSSIGRFLRDWAAAGLTDTLQSQKAGTWSPSECTARPGPLGHMPLLTHPLWPPLVHAAGCLPDPLSLLFFTAGISGLCLRTEYTQSKTCPSCTSAQEF